MQPSESILGVLGRASVHGEVDQIWEIVQRLDAPDTPPTLSAHLAVPTPVHAAWAAYALSDFDRAFRWALRSAEADASVAELQAGGRRPAQAHRGIELISVDGGSWLSRLDPSSPLRRVFERKTWVVVGGVMTALTLANWEIHEFVAAVRPTHDQPQIIYVRETPEQPSVSEDSVPIHVQISGEVHGKVTVEVGTTTITFTANPGSRWRPEPR